MFTKLEQAKNLFILKIKYYPKLTEEICELFDLMMYELEEYGMDDLEAERFITAVEELTNEK